MLVYIYSCLTGIILSILFLTLIWTYNSLTYWKKRGVPFIQALPVVGNFKEFILLKSSVHLIVDSLYRNEKFKNANYIGINMFTNPALVIKAPELIKQICISDFHVFCDRFATGHRDYDTFGAYNMFMLNNPLWKQVRSKFSPFFSGKIKSNLL